MTSAPKPIDDHEALRDLLADLEEAVRDGFRAGLPDALDVDGADLRLTWIKDVRGGVVLTGEFLRGSTLYVVRSHAAYLDRLVPSRTVLDAPFRPNDEDLPGLERRVDEAFRSTCATSRLSFVVASARRLVRDRSAAGAGSSSQPERPTFKAKLGKDDVTFEAMPNGTLAVAACEVKRWLPATASSKRRSQRFAIGGVIDLSVPSRRGVVTSIGKGTPSTSEIANRLDEQVRRVAAEVAASPPADDRAGDAAVMSLIAAAVAALDDDAYADPRVARMA